MDLFHYYLVHITFGFFVLHSDIPSVTRCWNARKNSWMVLCILKITKMKVFCSFSSPCFPKSITFFLISTLRRFVTLLRVVFKMNRTVVHRRESSDWGRPKYSEKN